MFKKLSIAALMSSAMIAGGAPVHADPANLKKFVYDVDQTPTVLHVSSTNGVSWNKIKPGNVFIHSKIVIDTWWPGFIYKRGVGIALGNCIGAACLSNPKVWSVLVNFNGSYGRDFSADPVVVAVPASKFLDADRSAILSQCNTGLAPDGPTKKHEFDYDMASTLVADTGKQWTALSKLEQATPADADLVEYGFPVQINHWKTSTFKIRVICDPVQKPASNDVAIDQGEFKVKDIKLSLTTFPGAVSHPNPATTCKKGRINVKLTASKAGATQFKLWTKTGDAPMTSKVIQAWAFHDGNGGFEAEHSEWVSVSKPSTLKAMAHETVSTIGKSTQWKSISLQCKGAGGNGGLSQDTSGYESTATLSIHQAAGKRCPRHGQIGFTATANYSEKINVRVTCNNGIDQSQWVQPVKHGDQWKATGTILFQVKKTIGMGCAIRQIRNGKATIKALATKQLNCNNQVVDTGAPDLTVGNDDPTLPVPPLKLSGDFSYVDHGSPKCARTGKALINFKLNRKLPVHYRLKCKHGTMSGVAQPIPDPKGGYIAPALKNFTISKTMPYNCELLAGTQPAAYKYNFGRKRHIFECRTPTTDPGPGTKTDPPRPASGLVTTGGIKVAPPKCENGWRTTCKREPHRTCKRTFSTSCKRIPKVDCRNVVKTQCKRVPKVECRNVAKRSCTRKPTRVCTTVRGKRVCKVKWTSSCKTNVKRVCKRSFGRKCQRTVKRECKRTFSRTCKREPKVTCNTSWKQSCKRERVTSCRR